MLASTPVPPSTSSVWSRALSLLASSPASAAGRVTTSAPHSFAIAVISASSVETMTRSMDARRSRRRDRPGDQRDAAHAPHVLAGHPLRPATRGNDGHDLAHVATLLPGTPDAGPRWRMALRVPSRTSGMVVVVDDGRVTISRGSVVPASTSSAGSAAVERTIPGIGRDGVELRVRLAPVRQIRHRRDGRLAADPVEILFERHPPIDRPRTSEHHAPAGRRREGARRATRPAEPMTMDPHPEPAERLLAPLPQFEGGEKLDLAVPCSAENPPERERYDRGRQPTLDDPGAGIRPVAGEGVGDTRPCSPRHRGK